MLKSLDAYQKKLVFFLSVATFFEGYDMFAVAQLLPNLRESMHLDKGEAGLLLSFISLGTVFAGVMVRVADRIGRKRTLSITILGYTVCSLLTAAAQDAYSFGVFQLFARVFLIGEWAVAMVMAAEEFPAQARATVIGIIQACSTFGGITCAGVVPLLLKSPLGWRTVYIAGAVPLVLVMIARRGLRETKRFSERAATGEATGGLKILNHFKGPYARRILQLGLIWSLTYVCTQTATLFGKDFAVTERSFTDQMVGTSLTIAAVVALPLVFFAGKVLDVLGRRKGGAVIFGTAAIGVFLAYFFSGRAELTFALVLAIVGTNAVLPLLNAYTTELFPTEMRGDAFALSNNLLGRIGYIVAPALVGWFAQQSDWSTAVSSTSVSVVVALALILLLLPETKGLELEQSSAMH